MTRLALALVLAACGAQTGGRPRGRPKECPSLGHRTTPAPSDGTPEDGGTITVRLFAEPLHLQPMADQGRRQICVDAVLVHHVLESLVRFPARAYDPVPELATSWEISEEGRRFVFHLRGGVQWHDGVAFTSDDVAFTFERIRDGGHDTGVWRTALEAVRGWETPDAATFVLELSEPRSTVLPDLARLSIIPRHVFAGLRIPQDPANRHPIGTGPYRFVSWQDHVIVVEKNPSYWGTCGHVDRFRYRTVIEDPAAWDAMEKGEIDLLPDAPEAFFLDGVTPPILRGRRMVPDEIRGFAAIAWRTDRPPFDDREMRVAMTNLVNRAKLRGGRNCLGDVVASPFPRAHPAHVDVEPWPYKPAKATELVARRGFARWDGDGVRFREVLGRREPLRFHYLTREGTRDEDWAWQIQKDLRERGIDMQVDSVDAKDFQIRLLHREYDAIGIHWRFPSPEPDLLPLLHPSAIEPPGWNVALLRDPRMTRLLDQIRWTVDDAARRTKERELQRLLHEIEPFTVIGPETSPWLVDDAVKGVSEGPWDAQQRDLWIPRAEQ